MTCDVFTAKILLKISIFTTNEIKVTRNDVKFQEILRCTVPNLSQLPPMTISRARVEF